MRSVRLGSTGLKVSPLCLGTMTFGNQADEPTSQAIFERSREAGINFFDTADVYVEGRSETILGRLIAKDREQLVVTSKVHGATGPGPNDRGSSRKHILAAIDASLSRLSTDYLDIYFLHQFDNAVPLEETFATLNDLVRGGKVRYLGVSNFSAWQTVQAQGICEREGWAPISCLQPMYNLVKRTAEVEILPMAAALGLGVIPYSPVGGGLLTGKYESAQQPASGRLVENDRYRKRYRAERDHQTAKAFAELAAKHGHHPVSLAVAWVAHHQSITAPIIGARSVAQLEPALKSAELTLSDELYLAVSALSETPPPATDRSEERA